MIYGYVGNALYWAQVAKTIGDVAAFSLVGTGVFTFIWMLIASAKDESADLRWPIRILVAGLIVTLAAGLVPNRETILLSVGVHKGADYAERIIDLVEKAAP
ncbi:MAG: hypothetical protein ACRC52_07460 [Aeromonas veronii]